MLDLKLGSARNNISYPTTRTHRSKIGCRASIKDIDFISVEAVVGQGNRRGDERPDIGEPRAGTADELRASRPIRATGWGPRLVEPVAPRLPRPRHAGIRSQMATNCMAAHRAGAFGQP